MANTHKHLIEKQKQPCSILRVRRSFIVRLYAVDGKLLEETKVIAKGKKTACKLAKFKHPIGWDYSILAEPENCA
jgi:hypothetical protein